MPRPASHEAGRGVVFIGPRATNLLGGEGAQFTLAAIFQE